MNDLRFVPVLGLHRDGSLLPNFGYDQWSQPGYEVVPFVYNFSMRSFYSQPRVSLRGTPGRWVKSHIFVPESAVYELEREAWQVLHRYLETDQERRA